MFTRRAVAVYIFTASVLVLAPVVGFALSVNDAPSNAELFKMIQQLQSQQAALLDKATKAEQEAKAAKAELAATKRNWRRRVIR